MGRRKVDMMKRMNMETTTKKRKDPKVIYSKYSEFKRKFHKISFIYYGNILGGKHGHKKFHKKGSKTTGFHHKANKDDYHKEHKFYDSEEKKGDHKKYGSDHEFHEAKKGSHKKGEKHDSGYDEGHKGTKKSYIQLFH